MTLLGYDDVGLIVDFFAALHPAVPALVELTVVFVGALIGLGTLVIILLAVNEHDDVGVLLDRTGFTQVGELRPLIVALLDGAAELREREDRNVQFLSDRLQAAGDFRDFLNPVFRAAGVRAAHQLEIVEHNEVQPVLALQAPRAGAQHRDAPKPGCRR